VKKRLSHLSYKLSAAAVAPILCLLPAQSFAAKATDTGEVFHSALEGAEHIEATAHHAGESAGLPQLDPSTYVSQVFWLAVCFAILYLFFSNKTLPEISSVLENRRNHINSDLEIAEDLSKKAETAQEEYEKGLLEAKAERARIMQDLDIAVQNISQKADTDFRKKSANEINVMEVRLTQSKSDAIEDMGNIAAEIASEAAKKIVGIDLDVDNAKSIVAALQKHKKAA